VVFLPLAEALRSHHALLKEKLNQLVRADADKFSALAMGYAQNGFVLYVPRSTRVEQDLKAVIHVRENGTIQNSQVLIVIDRGAEATLRLDYVGAEGTSAALHSGIVEVYLEEEARLHLVETQSLARNTWHFSHEKAVVGANAHLDWVYFAFGSKLSKSFLNVSLTGKGSEAHLNGLSITNSGQHLDLDTEQDHLAPITTSNLNFKAALLGKSRTVWQGMIYVDPIAAQTDGYQTSRNLLLDDRAHADAIPGLEIKTDDVRCSHGATISHVDEEMIFYLKSRGLDEATARDLIVNGFFEEIVDKVRDEATRDALRERISAKLADVD
jgi:Fe-S cluster assembly protein SufD